MLNDQNSVGELLWRTMNSYLVSKVSLWDIKKKGENTSFGNLREYTRDFHQLVFGLSY